MRSRRFSPTMGLHLGMEIQNWPPENIEDLAKRIDEPY